MVEKNNKNLEKKMALVLFKNTLWAKPDYDHHFPSMYKYIYTHVYYDGRGGL